MSRRPIEHELLRDAMFAHWVPVVLDRAERNSYPTHTIEHVLKLYGGQPPDRGYPPEWPKQAVVIEAEVNRLPSNLRAVVLVEFGLVRDENDRRLIVRDRCKALHLRRTRYHDRVYAAQAALWQCQAIRDLVIVTV